MESRPRTGASRRTPLLLAGIALAVSICIGLVVVVGVAFSRQDTRSVEALVIDPRRPQTVYAGTWGGGVFKSTDGGVRWHPSNEGLENEDVFSLAIDPTNSATVYAGTQDGVFRSTDGGQSWRLLGLGGWPDEFGSPIRGLAVDSNSRTIYAVDEERGLMKGTNMGSTWRDAGRYANTLALDPERPGALVIAVAESSFSRSGAVTTEYGLAATVDGGRTWRDGGLAEFEVDAVALAPHRPHVMYASASGGQDLSFLGGMFKSIDGGASWQPLGGNEFTFSPNGIAISPEDPHTVFVSTAGVSRTTDGGRTWQVALPTGGVNGSFVALAIDPTRPQTVYAGAADGRVFKSTDEGHTWRESDLP